MKKQSTEEVKKSSVIWENLEGWVRERIQGYLQDLLEEEVTVFLGREKSERRAEVKGSVSESWNNLESDPDKPRVTDRWTGAMLEYTFSSWPYLGYSLGYFRGTRRSSREPLGYNRHDEPMERLESTFDYAGGSWNASLYTSYARVGQAQRSSRLPTNTLMHYLSASFYPIESFSITPTLGYYSENYAQFDARTVTRSASLAMFYQPADHNIRYTAFGSYDSERNPTWDIERRSYYLDGGLIWSLGDSSIARRSLSLGFAYNRYMDCCLFREQQRRPFAMAHVQTGVAGWSALDAAVSL